MQGSSAAFGAAGAPAAARRQLDLPRNHRRKTRARRTSTPPQHLGDAVELVPERGARSAVRLGSRRHPALAPTVRCRMLTRRPRAAHSSQQQTQSRGGQGAEGPGGRGAGRAAAPQPATAVSCVSTPASGPLPPTHPPTLQQSATTAVQEADRGAAGVCDCQRREARAAAGGSSCSSPAPAARAACAALRSHARQPLPRANVGRGHWQWQHAGEA